jgi:hypothetical protein
MRSKLPFLLVLLLILLRSQATFAAIPEAAKDGFLKTSDGVRLH